MDCSSKGSCGSCSPSSAPCCVEKPNADEDLKRQQVSEYYGKTLSGTTDLKTSCCTSAASGLSLSVKKARSALHDEVMSSFYGCGSPIPPALTGATVLDLGMVFSLNLLCTLAFRHPLFVYLLLS